MSTPNDALQVIPVIDYRVRDWCNMPYPGHPKGCPNVGKSLKCPPIVGYYDQVYDLSKPVYAVIESFDLAKHVQKMREIHPKWTYAQCSCVLYWQQGVRKRLRERSANVAAELLGYEYEMCPEAMGVNVIKTMLAVGIKLKFPAVDVVHKIALCGYRRVSDSGQLEIDLQNPETHEDEEK